MSRIAPSELAFLSSSSLLLVLVSAGGLLATPILWSITWSLCSKLEVLSDACFLLCVLSLSSGSSPVSSMRLWLLPSLSDLLVAFSLLSPYGVPPILVSFISTPLLSGSVKWQVTTGLGVGPDDAWIASSSSLESVAVMWSGLVAAVG